MFSRTSKASCRGCIESGAGLRQVGRIMLQHGIFRLLSIVAMLVCVACDTTTRKRPIGYVRLGPAVELAQRPETIFSEARVLLRYDGQGFSAMSTACTHDLSALTRVGDGSTKRWVSSYSSSAYDDQGRVLVGPAKSNLPFYELKMAAGTYGGEPDTLFVEIGIETESSWRLAFEPPK